MLFPKFINNGIEFPVTQMVEIELSLIGAFTLMGAAAQLRILKILHFKLKEICREQKRLGDEFGALRVPKRAPLSSLISDGRRPSSPALRTPSTRCSFVGPSIRAAQLGIATPDGMHTPAQTIHRIWRSAYKVLYDSVNGHRDLEHV